LTSNRLQRAEAYLPLGVMSLVAALERHGMDDVILTDLNLEIERGRLALGGQFYSAAAATLASNGCDVYGFSTTCGDYLYAVHLAAALREIRPDVRIVFGGPHASIVSRQTLQVFPHVDIVVRGEAEETVCELCDVIEAGGDLQRVNGITYRSTDGGIVESPPRQLPDVEQLPFPAYERYAFLFRGSSDFIPLDVGRGCPFACTFCSTNDFFGRQFRIKSTERIIQEIRYLHDAYDVDSFLFPHDIFTINRQRVMEVCAALSEVGFPIRWNCSTRIDCADRELLQTMADAGCIGVHFGIETGSERMQKVIGKRLRISRAQAVVDTTLEVGIRPKNSFVIGFPEETEEDLRATLRLFLNTLNGGGCTNHLGVLAPLPGTPLFGKHIDEFAFDGFFTNDFVSSYLLDSKARNQILERPELFSAYYYIPNKHVPRSLIKFLAVVKVLALDAPKFLTALSHELDIVDELYPLWEEWCGVEEQEFPVEWYTQHGAVLETFGTFVAAVMAGRDVKRTFLGDLLRYEKELSCLADEVLSCRYRRYRAERLSLREPTDDVRLPQSRTVRLAHNICEVVKRLAENSAFDTATATPTLHILSPAHESADVRVLTFPYTVSEPDVRPTGRSPE
jgi:radical SAM superfamily enzyme YgiQ (UPF0313 family)